MSNKTAITAEPDVPTLRIERTFDAPRDKVFLAFTQKDMLEKWWSPWDTARIELDAREGGAWRFTDSTDGQEVTFYGYFHEVTAPERIVQTTEFAGIERGHPVLDRYEFTEENGRTLVTITEAFLSVEDRDAAIQSGMESGIVQHYVNLDKVLSH
jgi:uncharacterized protein YndB with AHSA1/START domain